jgi:hypothetical protein
MQEVYDIYGETEVTLAPTDLYVKFMPKDSSELHLLKDEYDLELFDYPLDIEFEDGDIFIESNMPDSILSFVYTTVKPDFTFPPDISYEVIEECYIPEEDEIIGTPTKAGEVYVEDAAYALLGYNEESTRSISWATPSGTITVQDNSSGFLTPVKGVKIRCHRFVKWSVAFTDQSGSYTMDKQFKYKPHYAIVFENIKGFDIWGNWGPIARANYNMGYQNNIGYSKDIDTDCLAWDWAVVNNAAYEYYQMCEATGITPPPDNLKIWVWQYGSSAPMLRRIHHPIEYNGHSPWLNYFINIGYGSTATTLNDILRYVLPDITITKQNQYRNIYNTVSHELSHSSHFSKVGSEFWAKYVSYIMTYASSSSPYGDGTGKNAELCGIGEMWGYFMGNILEFEKYLSTSFPNSFQDPWLCPQVLWDIYKNQLLSKKQIFECLKPEIDTYTELVQELYDNYPDKAIQIAAIINKYPKIQHNAVLPNTNGIAYDTFIINEDINSSLTINGKNILTNNCILRDGADITINIDSSITIIKPITIEYGATFEIKKTQ